MRLKGKGKLSLRQESILEDHFLLARSWSPWFGFDDYWERLNPSRMERVSIYFDKEEGRANATRSIGGVKQGASNFPIDSVEDAKAWIDEKFFSPFDLLIEEW